VRTLCERAVQYALDDDERSASLYFYAMELKKQRAKKEALDTIDTLIGSTTSARVMRGALTFRWELTETAEDFERLLVLMKAEIETDGLLSAAVYLHSKDKHDAALEVLAALLEANDPLALLLTAEWDIHVGRCEDAYSKVSSIGKDKESDVDVRGGMAFMLAMLVLDCGMVQLRDDALGRLAALSDDEARFDRQRVIDALIEGQNAKPDDSLADAT
jgi:hypothetical protein